MRFSRPRRAFALLAASSIGTFACGDLELTSGTSGPRSTTTTSSVATTATGFTTTSGVGGSTGEGGAGGAGMGGEGGAGGGVVDPKIFLILLENHTWGWFKGSPQAPFTNALLTQGAYAENYRSPAGIHPSLPNYLWLEAGQSFGVKNGNDPAVNHQSTKDHLVNLIEGAGRTWKSYQEGISGLDCPLVSVNKYAPKHNPMVYFDDVTDTNSPFAVRCITHVRPFREIDQDLVEDTVADYNFLTPDLCNDGHNACAPHFNRVKQADDWLAVQIPKLLASKAYTRGALILITWDEGENNLDGPLALIALGKSVKKAYSNTIPYTHSSTLRTVQTVLGVMPFLGDAANASDLGDLFLELPKK